MSPSIGIDFGTTKTLVAYKIPNLYRPEIAHLGREHNSIPTTAYISENGIWEFGDDADDHAADEAHLYVRNFKLFLGSKSPVIVRLTKDGNISYTALEVTAQYLKYIRQKCETEVFNGHHIASATITHPVDFSPAQIADLRSAAEQAGFSEVRLLREPEAAGLAFCHICPKDFFHGSALVVDWGGGTLDLALVSRQNENLTLHKEYSSGINSLGGIFFDELLLQDVEKRLQGSGNDSFVQDGISFRLMQLRRVREAKERLSRQASAKIVLTGSCGTYPPITYTRQELENLLRSHIQSGAEKAKALLASIKEDSLHPQQILFIGGSSQIPCISEILAAATKLECRRWQFSHEAIALGAAFENEDSDKREEKVLYERGKRYLKGVDVNKDVILAVECFSKAAERGYTKAQIKLAECHMKGLGVPQDYEKAVYWYTKAAQQGDAVAQCCLGWCYLNNSKNPRALENGVKWYIKSATQGYPLAQAKLAGCYLEGVGVGKDIKKAVEWYTMAAEQGEPEALSTLSLLFATGKGVQKDIGKAGKYLTMAVTQTLKASK